MWHGVVLARAARGVGGSRSVEVLQIAAALRVAFERLVLGEPVGRVLGVLGLEDGGVTPPGLGAGQRRGGLVEDAEPQTRPRHCPRVLEDRG